MPAASTVTGSPSYPPVAICHLAGEAWHWNRSESHRHNAMYSGTMLGVFWLLGLLLPLHQHFCVCSTLSSPPGRVCTHLNPAVPTGHLILLLRQDTLTLKFMNKGLRSSVLSTLK